MPTRKTWLLRLTEIREELQELTVPVLDRAMFERVFRVRRRRAIQLMQYFGGWQTGQAFLVDRLELLRQLEPLEASADYVLERRRRERLTEALENLRRQRSGTRVPLPVRSETRDEDVSTLPDGVQLSPGSLSVQFAGAEDLLGKLFELSQAAANDFDAFRRAAEGRA